MNAGKKIFGIAIWALMFILAVPNLVVNPLGIFADIGLLILVAVTTAILNVVPGGAKTSKIDGFWTATLLALALFFDLIQALLSLIDAGAASGNIVGGVQLTVFTFLFKMLGTSYWGGKKKFVANLTSKVTTQILEFVPVLAPFLPSTYIQMVFAIAIIRMEEKGGALGALAGKAGADKKPGVKSARRGGANPNIVNAKKTALRAAGGAVGGPAGAMLGGAAGALAGRADGSNANVKNAKREAQNSSKLSASDRLQNIKWKMSGGREPDAKTANRNADVSRGKLAADKAGPPGSAAAEEAQQAVMRGEKPMTWQERNANNARNKGPIKVKNGIPVDEDARRKLAEAHGQGPRDTERRDNTYGDDSNDFRNRRRTQSTPGGGASDSNVLDLKGRELDKAA